MTGGDSSSALLDRYLQEISKFPQITAEEEKELGRRIQQGDKAAFEGLVESNLRFVVSYAKKYRHGGVSLIDLINEGNIGLIQAAKKFDPGKNVRFLTYAVWWIRQAIQHALSEQGGRFRLPQKQANLLYRIHKANGSLTRELARTPTSEELAEEVGAGVGDVETLLATAHENVSLNLKIDEATGSELGDFIQQTLIPAPDDEITRRSADSQVRELVGLLSATEQEVVRRRFGLEDDEPCTLREIGEQLHLSRERVRQIESQALRKLRASSQARSLSSYMN